MISGQPEIDETFEIIEIANQVVQKIKSGKPQTVETFETIKIAEQVV